MTQLVADFLATGPKKQTYTRPVPNIDTITNFKWMYMPFVTADVMRDYLDTCYDISALMRLEDVKKVIREIKRAEKDYIYARCKFFGADFKALEERKSLAMQTQLKATFQFIHERICEQARAEIPECDENMEYFVSAAYMARFIYEAVRDYTDDYINIIREKFLYNTRNVMPAEFFRFGPLIEKMSETYMKMDKERVKIYSHEMKTIMHSAYFTEDPEEENK